MKKDTQQKRVCHFPTQRLRLSFGAIAFVLLASFSASASISDIEALLDRAEYAKAIDAITVELKIKDLAVKSRTKLYWLKAFCHISEDQIGLAKSSLVNLLATDPFFEPDANASPKILNLFKPILAKFKEQGGFDASVKTSFIPIEHLVSGEPLPFQIRIDDASLLQNVSRIELHLRRLGNSEFSSIEFNQLGERGLYEAVIPPILTRHLEHDVSFEYYVDVIGKDGARLGGIGKPTLPLHFMAAVKSKIDYEEGGDTKPSLLKAAMWVGAAAATVGGVILLVLVLSTPPEGSLNIKAYLPAE